MTSTPPSPPRSPSSLPRSPSSPIATILQGGGEGECMEQGEHKIPDSPAEHAVESVVDCAVAENSRGDDGLASAPERPSASGDQALEQVEISHAGEAGVDPTARDPAGTSMPTSPRRVSDLTVAVDSDSSGSSSWTAAAEGPSSPVTEPATHGSHWRSIVSGLLHMRRKSKSRSKEKAMRRLSTFPSVTAAKGERLQPRRRPEGGKEELHLEALDRWRPSWRSFSHLELATATDNFSSEKLIGRGGHAEVYKGCMPDGQLVAVKRLMKKDMEERVADFLAELGVIAHVNHPNAACLLGFGLDGGLHLVLKFSPHGSLASALHGSKEKLGWEKRFRIARGVAEGLLYLHEGCHRRIIHRDIKASNILLTEDYEPQISDFGLAKWLPERWNHHVVFPIEGTFGYMAPEYFMHGIVSEKTDAFAFGVLLLELITGRKAVDSDRQSLVIWAKPLLDAKDLEALVDPFLQGAYDLEEMGRSLLAASLCIHHLPSVRPCMKEVLNLLQGEELVVMGKDALKQPAGVPNSRPLLLATGDSEEENYTCSKYLSDLNRYKQLALEQ